MKTMITNGMLVVGFLGLMAVSYPLCAEPLITQDPTGVFDPAQSISVHGTGFGQNIAVGTVNLQYLGDNIEGGANGNVFTKTGWGVYQTVESNTEAVPRYSKDIAHSGSQSIKLDYLHSEDLTINRYKGHFFYDHGSMINKVYLSFWVRAQRMQTEGSTATGQWKIWRMKENTSFTDGSIDFIQNSFHPNLAGGNRIAALYTVRYQSAWDCNGCQNQPSTAAVYLSGDEVPGPNAIMYRWVRMEYWIDVGTLDNYDGTFVYKLHDPDNPNGPVIKDIPKLTFENNLNILKTGTNEDWKALLFGGAAVDGLDLLTYWDDVFVQIGSWARVEIGDAPTWSACTHREVQVPTAWSDTNITFNFQQGSFSPGDQVYVFVVDDKGVASAGKGPITVGGTVESSPPPQQVQGLRYEVIN